MIGTVACSSTRPTGPSLAQLSPLRPTSLSRRLVPAIKTRQQARACTVARRSQQLTSEDDAFATLKAPTPTCLASLTTSPSGLRGLKASRSLPQGEVVLFVPHTYSVSVPTGMTTHPERVSQSWLTHSTGSSTPASNPRAKDSAVLSFSLSPPPSSPPCPTRTPPQPHLALHVCGVHAGGAKSVAQWELEFLQPWQTKHGPLPPPLVDFLAGKC